VLKPFVELSLSLMKRVLRSAALSVVASLVMAPAGLAGETAPLHPSVIPLPAKSKMGQGFFVATNRTTIEANGQGASETAQYLADVLRRSTTLELPILHGQGRSGDSTIILSTYSDAPDLGPEGYKLVIEPRKVSINANTAAGLFYGAQTFLQLLPPAVLSDAAVPNTVWSAQCVRIEDKPRFAWRGLLLDVSRHFFSKEELKQLMDAMAIHKINVLQLHLTDDNGWRVEIKKYPLLTEKGAWRDSIDFGLDPKSSKAYRSDGKYGGFYTQDDIRELVKYAQIRNINIVPEIEMPSHAYAALSAYPEMRCTGARDSGIYCIGNESTFSFLQDVLTEIFTLFPGRYIHIGGDEAPGDQWMSCEKCRAKMEQLGIKQPSQLEHYMIERMGEFVDSHNKILVGWSEIKEGGGVPPHAVLMDWIGGAVDAANTGHQVVMAPTSTCYFDCLQSTDEAKEPKPVQHAYVPLPFVYAFDPIPPEVEGAAAKNIIGTEGCVSTEFIPSLSHAEYMTFPRLCALSEVAWSPKSSRNWNDFMQRLKLHRSRLDAMHINYRKQSFIDSSNSTSLNAEP